MLTSDEKYIMRYLTILFLLAGCTAGSIPAADYPDAAANAAVQKLVGYATGDFHKHGPLGVDRFRNVRSGYLPTASGARQYMLCGEFLKSEAAGKAEWMPFATIQTELYEQLLGGQSKAICEAKSAKWQKGDLSSTLQNALASLRAQR